MILLILLAFLAIYTYVLRYRELEGPARPDLERIPATVGGYESTDEYQAPAALGLLGADASVFRSYHNNEGRTIQIFVAYFGTQQENSQIHSPKHCYPGAGWDILEEGTLRLGLAGNGVSVKRLLISDGREQHEVVYWFDTRSGVMTNEFALKWFQMKSALMRRPQAAAFIRFSTEVTAGPADPAQRELARFIEEIGPHIAETLRAQAGPAAETRRRNG